MTQIVCANCGQALRPTDKFCYNCGAKVQPIKMKPEVEKAVPKPAPVKTAPSVLKQQAPQRPEVPEKVQESVPEKAPEERPKFHMDEAMSWNTDGYPEAKRHPVENPEETDFTWSDSTAQDRIRMRQEEGRESLYEKEAEKPIMEDAEDDTVRFFDAPEAEEVVKSVDAESTVPVDDFRPDASFEEAVEEGPEKEEAPLEAEEPEAEPEPEKTPAESFREAYKMAVEDTSSAEADDDYVVPTIESIEKDAEEAKARQAEKEIFGYTLDDIDSGARPEASGGAQVIDKFYTYSKKQEEFQALLDQENEKLKGNRPDAVKAESTIQDELDKAVASVEETAPEKPVETGGFVGVQLPETPESVEAFTEPAAERPAPEDAYKAPTAEDAYKAPAAEQSVEFLGGNFGKADDITRNAESQVSDDKSAAANTVAAAAGAVAAGAAAIAAAREKAKARVEAERTSDHVSTEVPVMPQSETAVQEPEVPAAPETEESAAEPAPAAEAPAEEKSGEMLFSEVVTEESEKEREKSLAEAAEEAAIAKAAEIKAEKEAADKVTAEEVKAHLEEEQKSVDAVVEETSKPEEEAGKEASEEDEHKLTYQDVFNEETEKTPKHTFLKVLAILILILIILEVAAILIRRFAPDSAIGMQIQQIYEMLFSRFL